MNKFLARMKKLETALQTRKCPDCSVMNSFKFHWAKPGEPSPAPLHCERCGRKKVLIIVHPPEVAR